MRAHRSDIADYLAELDHELQGPWLARRSIMQELHDGLTDAADAYRAAGVSRPDAERRAIGELGPPADVAAAFDQELTAHTGRQTAWLLLVFSALTFATANLVWQSSPAASAGVEVSPSYAVLAQAVDLVGAATILVGVLAVAAFGWAARWVGSVARITRVVGWLVFATSGAKLAGGVLLWLGAPAPTTTTASGGAVVVLIYASTAWLALSAAQCLVRGSACRA
jgi:hypothetical protein